VFCSHRVAWLGLDVGCEIFGSSVRCEGLSHRDQLVGQRAQVRGQPLGCVTVPCGRSPASFPAGVDMLIIADRCRREWRRAHRPTMIRRAGSSRPARCGCARCQTTGKRAHNGELSIAASTDDSAAPPAGETQKPVDEISRSGSVGTDWRQRPCECRVEEPLAGTNARRPSLTGVWCRAASHLLARGCVCLVGRAQR
jgi:hypothetical protein